MNNRQWTSSKPYDWKTDVALTVANRPGILGLFRDLVEMLTGR